MKFQKISPNGILYMEGEEGREKFEYLDSTGNPTIGIGHKLTVIELGIGTIVINTDPVEYRYGLTDKQIDDLLLQDMSLAELTVNRFVTVLLSQHQFDALCSFCFNIGVTAFTNSTLLRLLNNGNYKSVPEQMRRWNKGKVNGEMVVIKGLVNRREHDVSLWEGSWRYPKKNSLESVAA